MTSHDTNDFRAIVAASELFKNRWETVAARVTAIAADEFGVVLDREAVLTLPEARICTISDSGLDAEQLKRELLTLPAVKAANDAKRLKREVESGDETAIASLPRGPAARINLARKLKMGDGKHVPVKTAESEARLLARLMTLSPQQRISKGREWGVIK